MKHLITIFLIVTTTASLAQQPINFDDYFMDRSLRIDLYQVGDAQQEFITLHQIYQEGIWSENPQNLIEPFSNGRYSVKVYDVASNALIYSRGFDCMFGEYRTTTPAINGIKRVYERSVRIPVPKKPVQLVIEKRDKRNIPAPFFSELIDPAHYSVIKEKPEAGDFIYPALQNGDPHQHVDFVFLGEGYTSAEQDKFKTDVDEYIKYLFTIEPYKSHQKKFNITGILRPSPESAMDEPRQGVYKKTTFKASFNAFDLDRYMLTEKNHLLREVAGQVPYDAIILLVNSKRYGGGGIYNDYCVSTVDNSVSKRVFIHELGHSFAGLADEYYSSEVAYNDFYPKGVEPLEPNITALLDPAHVKWQALLSPGIAIPTEYGKEQIEALQLKKRENNAAMKKEVEAAKGRGTSENKIKSIEKKYQNDNTKLDEQIAAIRQQYAHLTDKVGVFEGAGYSSKGLYRPMINCMMISNTKDEFCVVCQKAIERMILYYAGE